MYERLHALARPFGEESRALVVGARRILIEGLDAGLSRLLEQRWGGFLQRPLPGTPDCRVTVFRAGSEGWLEHWSPGDLYRIEADGDATRRVVASYYFAVSEERGRPRAWRLGVTEAAPDEPIGRTLDNALRFVTATLALDEGGFAMHSAGVLRDGRAYLLLGPSGAGKSTATDMLAPGTSLGDDFGIVLPLGGRWVTPALPFDNSECIQHEAPEGFHPVAGIWRLRQSKQTRVEALPSRAAATPLMACLAFPWAIPERAGEMLDHVGRFLAEGKYRELHFSLDAALWDHLE